MFSSKIIIIGDDFMKLEGKVAVVTGVIKELEEVLLIHLLSMVLK